MNAYIHKTPIIKPNIPKTILGNIFSGLLTSVPLGSLMIDFVNESPMNIIPIIAIVEWLVIDSRNSFIPISKF